VLCLSATVALGADWPQYRYDAGRTAACEHALPANPGLLWVRQLPAPRPAFPAEVRLCYDASYEPVVMGTTMFVPSMVTDSVLALDTRTGQVRWRFFAEGPVRLAPVAWRQKVYFVSDDGYLYCLGAADGKLLWKFRGLPAGREDRKVMGDGRLVSVFPARGGPVLADGIIYFAAGIWSDEGVFVHAVNAESGKAVWSNTDSDRIANANPEHGFANYGGICPQGHLAIVNNKLVVPCGVQLPALLDLKTGKLHKYTIGWGGRYGLPRGCTFVCGIGKYLMHGGDLYDMGQPTKQAQFKRGGEKYDVNPMFYLGALKRLQIARANRDVLGAFRQPVLTAGVMYYQQDGIAAYDLTKPTFKERSLATVPEYRRGDRYPDPNSAEFRPLWKLPSESKVHIKARGRLYCGRPGVVEALDLPADGRMPAISWQAKIEGTPHRMLSGDGKLFVVTREGRIYAFGGDASAEPVAHRMPEPPPPGDDAWATKVAKILKTSRTVDGYIVILGLSSPRLAEELVRQSRCDVIVIQAGEDSAAALRRRFDKIGLYGTRISVRVGDPMTYRLPPYVATLVVPGDPNVGAKASDPRFVGKLYRCLRPYGGTACLEAPASLRQALSGFVSAGRLPGRVFRDEGGLVLLSRRGMLGDTADWSHAQANPANTGASRDRRLTAPLTRLWFHGTFRWGRKPWMTDVRVASGRILILSDKLYAFDVYTGRPLWQAPVSVIDGGGVFVAVEDAIHATRNSRCAVINPADGGITSHLPPPGDGDKNWSYLAVTDEIIVGAADKRLACIDRKSGKTPWDHPSDHVVNSIAVGATKAFAYFDDKANRRRGRFLGAPTNGETRAFDIRTGELLWKAKAAGEVRYCESLDLLVVGTDVYRGKDGGLVRRGAPADQVLLVDEKLVGYRPNTLLPPRKGAVRRLLKRSVVEIRDVAAGDERGPRLE